MTRPVRVAVIGAGLVAQRSHLPAYVASDEVEIAALVSGRVETARAVAPQFGSPPVLRGWEEAVADPTIDAIDICTPNALHAPIAIAAARAGKHVLVEKPMAMSLDEADAMVEAARQAGVVLMVAHNLRFVPIYETVKRVVAEGTIGRPLAVRGVFMHAGPDEFWGATSDWFWKPELAGGGSLLDMGIHMIDLVRWFVDRPVVEVAAMTARSVKPTAYDDNAIVLLRFEGDAIASVQSSWVARPFPDRQVTIHGELGHLAMGRSAEAPLAVHLLDGEGGRKVVPEIPAVSERVNPFVHFVRCVREGKTPLTSGEEGRASLAVALAAYEAAGAGRTVRGRWS
ncbi:MAG: Gfo/Idh/MocA family protein [Dehalococcoidia bacterium]